MPMINSPRLAYWRMFRASSEIAVAIRAWSLSPKPSSAASWRPLRLASTTSTSLTIGTRSSSHTRTSIHQLVPDDFQAVVQVECGAHLREEKAKLHHRERHRRLNADDDRLGAFQPDRPGDVLQRPSGKGVDDVEPAHVDDHGPRPVLAHAVGQLGL